MNRPSRNRQGRIRTFAATSKAKLNKSAARWNQRKNKLQHPVNKQDRGEG